MSSPPTWTCRPTAKRPTTCPPLRCAGPISPTNLLQAVSPAAIIHLAAIIPPACYARPGLARRVNVDATGLLIDAAAALPNPPRFVQASSVAAYGARNPHPLGDLLTADTPLRPSDVYGVHQMEAENLLRASRLDWVILRLGGVRTAERMGWRRYPARPGAPVMHALLKHRSPYRRHPGRYAAQCGVIDAKWTDPSIVVSVHDCVRVRFPPAIA